VARLVTVGSAPLGPDRCVARGAFVVPDSIDIDNDEVESLFHGTHPVRLLLDTHALLLPIHVCRERFECSNTLA
jgi:hypothetical protein